MAVNEKVSGIGANSERTDLNVSQQPARYISGLPYGQGQETYSNQTQASMAGSPYAQEMPTPLMAPTSRPNEAITTGINVGDGAGSEVMRLPMQQASLANTLQSLIQYDPSGEAELAYRMVVDSGSMA